MVEKESKWILPKNLRKQEERERKAVENETFDGGGGFWLLLCLFERYKL